MLCDKKFPFRLKGKFYRVSIKPTLLYGLELWFVKKIHETKIVSSRDANVEVNVQKHNDG